MLDLAEENAMIALKEKFSLIERDEERTVKAVERLGIAMGIDAPYRIEAFDNSNIQGVDPVSAMVVFLNGNLIARITESIRLKQLKDQMIMDRCAKSLDVVMSGY